MDGDMHGLCRVDTITKGRSIRSTFVREGHTLCESSTGGETAKQGTGLDCQAAGLGSRVMRAAAAAEGAANEHSDVG